MCAVAVMKSRSVSGQPGLGPSGPASFLLYDSRIVRECGPGGVECSAAVVKPRVPNNKLSWWAVNSDFRPRCTS